MKILVFILLLFSPCLSRAQEGVRIHVKTDEFTGDKSVHTDFTRFSSPFKDNINSEFMFYYSQSDNLAALVIRVQSRKSYNYAKRGSDFFIKLENGEVIKLTTIDDPELEESYVQSACMITLDELKQLAYNKIDKCRLDTDKGYIEFTGKVDKNRRKVQNAAAKLYKAIIATNK